MSDPIGPGDLDIWRNPFVERLRRKPGLRWWQWSVVGLLVFALVSGGTGIYLYFRLQGDITDPGIVTEDIPEEEELEPFNALLVGSDSREGLTEEEQELYGAGAVPGERADTLILAHIDPAANKVVMVQFPRDLYVPVAGRGSAKVNSALEDGAGNLVATIRNLTGLPIHHYAEVNIAGFRDIVDAIGGVDVCITEPIPFDPQTGIEITEDELGMVHFDGELALRFVRSRAFPTGDFARIQNQQRFVSAALDKVTSVSTFLSPARLLALYRAAGDNLTVDRNTTLGKLREILGRIGSIDPVTHEAYITPNLGLASNEAGSVVLPDETAMAVLFEAMGDNVSPQEADGIPDVTPGDIQVAVLDAGYAGGPVDAATQLVDATAIGGSAIDIVSTADSTEMHQYTFVRHPPGAEEEARFIAAALPHAVVEEGGSPPGVDVAVYPGRFFETRRVVQLAPLELPAPSDPPAACR